MRAALPERTAAVIIEPIQGEGGVTLPPAGYLQEVRRACPDAGAVLIFDEIQTGAGRTGTFYAFEAERVVPDVITLAKGLAGGVPIGAMLANEEVARGFEPGTHASTFGGNPFATAAALYVQRAIDELGLLENCREMGGHLGSALLRLAERRRPKTRGARGRGLLQGLIIEGDPADLVARARAAGLLLSVAGANVVRFAPPLIVGQAEIDEAIEILDRVLSEAK
jgi:acetylornithine/succinyldiaminopimelate/putrescine aminotransferase